MKNIYILFLICIAIGLQGQNGFVPKQLKANKIQEDVEIDGILDEEIWSKLDVATGFVQYFPTDNVGANGETEIYMCYDDHNLYVGIKCHSNGDDWNVNSLRRDYRGSGMDNVTLLFDSFQDKTNAFFFGINPEGAIREGVVSNGGNDFRDFDESWDNKWRGEAVKFDGYYSAELEIPFSVLRFNQGSEVWKMGAYRFDAQGREWSTWTGIPNNYPMMNLAFNGDLIFEKPLESSGSKLAFIPYITSGMSKDFEAGTPTDFTGDFGGDAKIGISSGLNLDLTINPDFSQVEVDRQITDLSRFEIFFPERRQFFLENADLFSGFGFSGINPFFSRRIGVAKDLDGNTVQNRIYLGARLSGKVNNDFRIGLMNMQTGSDLTNGIHAANYAVAAIQHKVLDRSNLSFIVVNKQTKDAESDQTDINEYNRVFGMDFNYANVSNSWFGKTFLHTSMSPATEGIPVSHGLELNHDLKNFGFTWSHEYVQDDYMAEVGFVRRTNYFKIQPKIGITKYPNGSFVNNFGIEAEAEVFWRPGFGRTDHTFSINLDGTMADNARFRFSLNQDYVYLFNSFDPTGTGSTKLEADTEYNYISFSGFYFGDQGKQFTYSFRPFVGQYFNGWRYGMGGSFTLNYRPRGSISIDMNWNLFDMPYLEENKQTFLIGPRIDYTFSKKIFLTTFIQYNTQSDNTNINARFQWRFAPVSDFFIVYTDNYLTGNVHDPSDRFAFDIKNRSIVMKMTYWLNL